MKEKPTVEELEELVEQLKLQNSTLTAQLNKSKADLHVLQKEHEILQGNYQKDIAERWKAEEKLKNEKEFNQKVLECLPGIFYLYTYPQLRLIYWNKNHEKLLGFTADEIRNRHIMEWHVPGVEPIVQQAVDLVMEKGENVLESPLLNKKGEYIPFLMTGISFDTPEQRYLMGFGIDITDRKKIEQAQKESESLFRLLAENSTDIIASHNENGEFLYVSPSCKTLLGYDPKELIGRSAFEFIHPDDKAKIEESWQNFIANPSITTFTFRILSKSGIYIWFETVLKSIFDDTSGKLKEIHASSRDISQRKLNEDKLEESETKLTTLFNAMTEMVVIHEVIFDDNGNPKDYKIIDCNKAYTAITGIKKEDALGKLGSEVYQMAVPPYLGEFSKVALSGEAFEYTTYYAPMDKHFIISVVSPGPNKFATITTDITAVHEIQEIIQEKNKELENYLYVASHDLRSPLVNIQGFSQRFQKHVDAITSGIADCNFESEKKQMIQTITSEEIPRTLNFILSNVAKMDLLINGLLQISRTGRIKMNIVKVNMNLLFKTILENISFQLSEIGATANIEALPDCYGDSAQLNQLFSNIIVNAIKYRDSGRPLKICISGKSRYNKVIYKVQDTGMGIAERHQSRIWDVFYRVGSSTEVTGEGLGLSIAKRIADKHKGKIWVESEEGVGSTFFVELLNTEFSE